MIIGTYTIIDYSYTILIKSGYNSLLLSSECTLMSLIKHEIQYGNAM